MKHSEINKEDACFIILLYHDPSSKTLYLKEIKNYLLEQLGEIDVRERSEFFSVHLDPKDTEKYAKVLASCKVNDQTKSTIGTGSLPGEVKFEKTLIKYPERRFCGIMYDGYRLTTVFQGLIPPEELNFNILHVVFTPRLFGTCDEKDSRYHARVIICGYPSLISTTGIVEAPAKPKEFYFIRRQSWMLGMEVPPDSLKKKLKGLFIDYDDPRLTEVMKGYVMQSVFFHLTNEPFCTNKNCRLYNAHWQKEVIDAQLKGGGFCVKHEKILKDYREQGMSSN